MKKQNKFISKDAEALWNKLHNIAASPLPDKENKIDIKISNDYNISTRKKKDNEGVWKHPF